MINQKLNTKIGLLTMLMLLFSCTENIVVNEVPELNISHQINALEVTISGNAIDTDGTVHELLIDWGDNYLIKLINEDFSNINKSHSYAEPSNYIITITAFDDTEDSIVLSIPVTVDYKNISLETIKETMFKTADNEYLILTINLHTYQENAQEEKFKMLTDFIGQMDVDFIALQECAQHKSSVIVNGIIREDNMALIITNKLKESYNTNYNLTWEWAHYGWDVWEEGVAILSKHELLETEDRFISSNTTATNITSRKVIYGSYQIPQGRINLFSAHTHWRLSETDEEQTNQMKNIKQMVDEKETLNSTLVSFVCGDINSNPTSEYPWSEGYNTMMLNNEYLDSFLEIYSDANNKPAQSIYSTIGGDFPGRIDYIFMRENSHFRIMDSQIIFTSDVLGKISDHNAVITKIAYIN